MLRVTWDAYACAATDCNARYPNNMANYVKQNGSFYQHSRAQVKELDKNSA